MSNLVTQAELKRFRAYRDALPIGSMERREWGLHVEMAATASAIGTVRAAGLDRQWPVSDCDVRSVRRARYLACAGLAEYASTPSGGVWVRTDLGRWVVETLPRLREIVPVPYTGAVYDFPGCAPLCCECAAGEVGGRFYLEGGRPLSEEVVRLHSETEWPVTRWGVVCDGCGRLLVTPTRARLTLRRAGVDVSSEETEIALRDEAQRAVSTYYHRWVGRDEAVRAVSAWEAWLDEGPVPWSSEVAREMRRQIEEADEAIEEASRG